MKRILILAAALFTVCTAFAQSEYNLQRRSLFEVLPVYSSDIVFLGNSITDGCEWAELFNNRHVKNRGISGDRSGWLLDRLDPIVGGHPKKLFLMIGVNDLAAGVSPDEIVANVARLIDRFQSESRWTKIYVQSILPVNGESFAKFKNHYEHGRQIVPLNKRLEALCDEKEVTYLDVWGALADHEGRLDKRYTNDGLHLTGEGYVVWRDAIKQHVKEPRAVVESHIPADFAPCRRAGRAGFRRRRLCARSLPATAFDRHRRGGRGQRHCAGRGARARTEGEGLGLQDFRHGDGPRPECRS